MDRENRGVIQLLQQREAITYQSVSPFRCNKLGAVSNRNREIGEARFVFAVLHSTCTVGLLYKIENILSIHTV